MSATANKDALLELAERLSQEAKWQSDCLSRGHGLDNCIRLLEEGAAALRAQTGAQGNENG